MAAHARNPFSRLRKEHPRLMATAEEIDRVKKFIDSNEEGIQAIKAAVIKRAEKELGAELPNREADDFLKETRTTLRRLQALGMAWLLEKDARYVRRARRDLSAVCDFPDWNPLHFLDTAEMTHAVAISYDWFYGEWSEREQKRWATAIIEKGLRPGLAHLRGTARSAWPTQTTNWNIVCNAGLVIGALAVADVDRELAPEVFWRCLNSVPTGFRGYSPDGAWDEGPGYWAYATEYAVYLLAALSSALGDEFGLGDLPGFSKGGFFRMHAGGEAVGKEQPRKLFNFSDCDEERGGSWCMRWLSQRYKEPRYNWMAFKDGEARPMDLLWFFPKEAGSGKGIPRNIFFHGTANVAMLRGSWDRKSADTRFRPWAQGGSDNVYLGIRAGANSRENAHGQLDLGSFVLDALKVRWAMDPPPVGASGDYYGDYFLPGYYDVAPDRRFRYYRTGTVGHNTLVINGFNQPLGVQTEIVGFRDASPGLVVVVLDLTAAYPDCLRARRGFALIGGRHVLIVDELTPKQEMTVAWQMHTQAEARGGSVVTLTQERPDQDNRNFFVRLLEPRRAGFTIEKARVTQPREAPSVGVRKLVATLTKVSEPTRISVYLSAERKPIARLPKPLSGPLSSWIAWTGEDG